MKNITRFPFCWILAHFRSPKLTMPSQYAAFTGMLPSATLVLAALLTSQAALGYDPLGHSSRVFRSVVGCWEPTVNENNSRELHLYQRSFWRQDCDALETISEQLLSTQQAITWWTRQAFYYLLFFASSHQWTQGITKAATDTIATITAKKHEWFLSAERYSAELWQDACFPWLLPWALCTASPNTLNVPRASLEFPSTLLPQIPTLATFPCQAEQRCWKNWEIQLFF